MTNFGKIIKTINRMPESLAAEMYKHAQPEPEPEPEGEE